jgi:hypothetical protein
MAESLTINNKPLHRLTWNEKQKDNRAYFRNAADYYISNSHFTGFGSQRADMQTMYNVYNNQIPTTWFNHITDPLSAKDAQHSKFPAKIRPTNILRTNIDLLLGEWPRRPFKYRVENLGDDGYNQFMLSKNKAVEDNLQQHFMAAAQEQAQADGTAQEGELSQQTPDQLPMPDAVGELFKVGYKDKQAIKGQKWMKRALVEYSIKRKLHKMFKDWLIAGEAISYKNIHQGELEYRRLSPLYSDYDKSPDTDFIEDGEWFTHMFFMTPSDVVDLFYDELDNDAHGILENYTAGISSPSVMYDYLTKTITTEHQSKVPVYMTIWKGRKLIYHITYQDPTTGEPQKDTIDEAEYATLSPDMKKGAKAEWVNEVYETWRIADKGGIYVRMQPVPAQRNAMNNFSVCKLPANGRKYSDTHSNNISVMQIGIPYLIMYMITGRALELTIAKSKGKILIMDNNAVPRTKGWNEEKFFYYSEALGYALIDRNQIGVDKSFNQYQVLDMSLYDQIEQLINLQQHFKQEWDDIIGISRQRKAQTMASETNSSNERAIFQSTVITEMIYSPFEEFIERELQGLLDLSKFTNAEGLRKLYNGSDLDDVLLEIDPEEYCSAALGVFVTDNPQDYGALDIMKQQIGTMLQNGIKPSTVLEVVQAGNIADLRAKLKQIEDIEAQMEQQKMSAEQQAEESADERKERFLEYEKMLEEQLINAEYDRKEDLEYIRGNVSLLTAPGSDGDIDNNGQPDIADVIKAQTAREKMMSDERKAAADRASAERIASAKNHLEKFKQLQENERAKKEETRKDKEHAQKMQKGEQDIRKAKAQAKKAAAPKPKK